MISIPIDKMEELWYVRIGYPGKYSVDCTN